MVLTSSDCGCGTESDGSITHCDACFNAVKAKLADLMKAAIGVVYCNHDLHRAIHELRQTVSRFQYPFEMYCGDKGGCGATVLYVKSMERDTPLNDENTMWAEGSPTKTEDKIQCRKCFAYPSPMLHNFRTRT